MANYCCTIRTNYFHVKDEAAFRALMERVYGSEDSVDLWERPDAEGNIVFGFGCYGGIAGLRNAQEDSKEAEDLDDTAYDEFIDGLQKCVADNDAIIILEVGNEKLSYVIGSATIITSKDVHGLDITNLAVSEAAAILNTPAYTTRCEY